MRIKLITDAKASLKKIGVSVKDTDLSLVNVFSSDEYELYIKKLWETINSFKVKRILFLDDDYYVNNVSDKIKNIKRAVGKNGLMELKKNVIKKEDAIVDNRNYFIDMIEISDDVSFLAVEGIYKTIYSGGGVYFFLQEGLTCESDSLLGLIKSYNDECSISCKLHFGETLTSERYFILTGVNEYNNSHLLCGVTRFTGEEVDKLIEKTSHHYPMVFEKQILKFETRSQR
ncbi:hypothetical protein SMKC082_15730 [Serratia marcescens]|uniref:hypothetical protein n=1 Tax=Serratia TaxID=613 RepID=UPI001591BB4A|nr:hypothetical protein [Serratia marcescens]BEN78163.1 hypothetical protein SMKC082_15730 [Serratia marcescens]BEO47088.1 hypothetical protein SMQE20_16470 [Serratia marcescens]